MEADMTYRFSKQREAVMEVLDKKNYHPTVDEIYDIVKKQYPQVSLATIYRNVEQLSQMDKIWKIEIPEGPARYDGNMEKHYHIRCKKCGKVNDVWLKENLNDIINFASIEQNFSVTGYKIEFEGICDSCNNKTH
jgi:Fe2+ or Zn2+ uptake regulation protein